MKHNENLPWQWTLILALLFAVGGALAWLNPQMPWATGLSDVVRADAWARLLGIFVFSIPVSHWLVYYAMDGVDTLFGLQGESTRQDLWSPTLVGVVESVLYPFSILADKAEFIGVWLAVKVAGQWVRWGTNLPASSADAEEDAKKGRRRFNKFLVGNGLRIALAAATYLALKAFALKTSP